MNPHVAAGGPGANDSPSGSQPGATVHVVCAHCATSNRVPVGRLGDDPKCGSCKLALLPGKPFELTQASFERHVAGSDLPLIVDFWAAWCGPCRMMAPAYEHAAARLAPKIRLAKLDTDRAPEIAARFGIRSIPTLIAFKHGREIARQSGAMSPGQIVDWIQRNV
jgi:thioredoxin 2